MNPPTSGPYESSSYYNMSGGSGYPPHDLSQPGGPPGPGPWDHPSPHPQPDQVYGGPPSFGPSTGPAPDATPGVEQMSGPAAMFPSSSPGDGPHPQYPPPVQHNAPPSAPPPGTFAPPPGPGYAPMPMVPQGPQGLSAPVDTEPPGIRAARGRAQMALQEYLSLQKKRKRAEGGAKASELDQQIRVTAARVTQDLSAVRKEVRNMIKEAETHRWRKWLIGGLVASVIPVVKRLFRRSPEEKEQDKSVTDMEHAFSRSREILSRIKDTVLGRSGFASMAFFVFAVLYVFSNEVSLMVAKTVNKRVKSVSNKLYDGQEIDEKDIKLLDGWRWRILLLGR
ncbi:hypothetical protein SODALDRAFT_326123 [Sodiomyces alkalinus F11]|uniref:Uncharacterized protein n=1 Tax=Sodiomyces alkalinus (strain CBS 110278 / VKM F-3762 / F11) TaxID=1314773 RepID=A0A3N2Q589_SODAK|nr:hypothetical protein SODALDRAFT_326123 [Sodiomyces alkalinus F11]ROT41940.1 hypothetical protein SODALDRAFT_326123 [Sodiomyces alkalinus F11]